MHLGNNKQDANLPLAIFHETTIAPCKSYLLERQDTSSLLTLVNNWWTIANAKKRFVPNAITAGDGKMDFLQGFAEWLEEWSLNGSSTFALTKQTSSALVQTLHAQCSLVKELLVDGFDYVRLGKLQSDSLEKRSSQYGQMNCGRFLVGLREVIVSERILACKSLLKCNILFWNEDIGKDKCKSTFEAFENEIDLFATQLQAGTRS